jgi:hypothetical protein
VLPFFFFGRFEPFSQSTITVKVDYQHTKVFDTINEFIIIPVIKKEEGPRQERPDKHDTNKQLPVGIEI